MDHPNDVCNTHSSDQARSIPHEEWATNFLNSKAWKNHSRRKRTARQENGNETAEASEFAYIFNVGKDSSAALLSSNLLRKPDPKTIVFARNLNKSLSYFVFSSATLIFTLFS